MTYLKWSLACFYEFPCLLSCCLWRCLFKCAYHTLLSPLPPCWMQRAWTPWQQMRSAQSNSQSESHDLWKKREKSHILVCQMNASITYRKIFCCNNVIESRGEIIFAILHCSFYRLADVHNKTVSDWLCELAGGSKGQCTISKINSSLLLPI